MYFNILLFACTCVFGITSAIDQLLVAKTTAGIITGFYNDKGIRQWKGIPYANPPVGNLRWTTATPTLPFISGSYSATFDAPGCPQQCNLPPGNCPEYGQSEDCLYLSIFSPKEPSTNPQGYPVMFWIHGGAFEQGLGNCALYDGSDLASKNVVSVVINYRLGVLGYMASKSMEGNYGFTDQQLALNWTKNNIGSFGGNPSQITIAGQSAGAMSTSLHMISPNSKGLFTAAIMESNPLALPYHTRDTASANAKSAFEYLNCREDDVECMKSKSVEEILDAQSNSVKLNLNNLLINFLPWAPMVVPGSSVIPEQTLTAIAGGRFGNVPILAGSMYDEGQLFVYELFTKPVSKIAYKTIIEGTFGINTGKQVLKYYPFDIVPDSVDGRDALNVMATDLLFYCPLRNITVGMQQTLGISAPISYNYRFKHVLSFDAWGPDYTFCVGVVCHGSELPFVFSVWSFIDEHGNNVEYYPTSDEQELAVDMSNAWSNFVNNYNPNTGLPTLTFPTYKSGENKLLVLDIPGSEIQQNPRSFYCDFWDSIGYFF